MSLRYPISIRFKILTLAEQMSVIDATGAELFYVKQKMFKLKEKIEIFQDSSKANLLYTVQADRILDFSPEYTLKDAAENAIGSIKRHGKKSLWRANYDVSVGDQKIATIHEVNPSAKVMDSLFGELPIIGLFTGYFFHPVYAVESAKEQGKILGYLRKERAFFEGKFTISGEYLSQFDENTQRASIALLMVAVLMERDSG